MPICINPECGRKFIAGRYGARQVTCGKARCVSWYKTYLAQTRRVQTGIPRAVFSSIAKASSCNPCMNSLLLFVRETGLRKGEALGLLWGDVFEGTSIRHTVSIVRQWDERDGFKMARAGRTRLAYLSSAARTNLMKYYRGLGHRELSTRIKAMRIWGISESGAWKYFISLQKKLQISNPETGYPYKFHDLRHMVGFELVRAGRPDLAQKMLGHRRIETTMAYATPSPDDVIGEMESVRKGDK